MATNTGPAKSLYSKLKSDRDAYLTRARDCARLTIPTLIPPSDDNNAHTKYTTPYQGLGARGVNNLASKLLLSLLPPNTPFFKLSIDDFTLEQMTQQEGMRADVEEALNKVERAVMTELETSSVRISGFEALKHLLVAGNVLVFEQPDGQMRVFPLFRYVVRRDPIGNVLEIVTLEKVSPKTVKPEILETCQVEVKDDDPENKNTENTLEVYTWIRRNGGQWDVSQELNGIEIPGSDGSYPLDKCPWLALRWNKVDNEDYGRGYIEEYLGDLQSLEALTMAIVQGSAAAAKVLILVKPNGTTSAKVIAEAPNGAVREGDADEVTVLQMDKFHDFQVALKTIEMIVQRLSFAFMLNTSIQRSGERVTAEEIRFMAGELEDALGGVYSILSQEFQLPLVKITMENMAKRKKLPRLPNEVKPMITTGLEALGRGHDLQRLQIFFQHLAPLGGETLMLYMNLGDYIKRVGTALGIDMKGLVRSQKEVDAQRQQAQMQELTQALGPKFMEMLKQGMAGQAQGQVPTK